MRLNLIYFCMCSYIFLFSSIVLCVAFLQFVLLTQLLWFLVTLPDLFFACFTVLQKVIWRRGNVKEQGRSENKVWSPHPTPSVALIVEYVRYLNSLNREFFMFILLNFYFPMGKAFFDFFYRYVHTIPIWLSFVR